MGKAAKVIQKLVRCQFRELADRTKEQLTRRKERRHYLQGKSLFREEKYSNIFKASFIEKYKNGELSLKFAAALHERDNSNFFPGFAKTDEFAQSLKEKNPGEYERVVSSADKIIAHKFPVFALGYISYGNPVRWNHDPVNNITASDCFYGDIDYLNVKQIGDSKITWELSRFQWVYDLGQAYVLTGDEKYARKFFQLISDWSKITPDYQGINFCSALEFAFRVHSLLWGIYFFKDSDALSEDAGRELYRIIYLSAIYIENHLSTYFSPNTHLLGEAYGLYITGLMFPEFAAAERWKDKGYKILLAELDKQVTDDGMHAELSNAYHVYTLEFILSATILAQRNHDDISSRFINKLDSMTGLLNHLRRPDGNWSHVGDEDGGRLFFLSRESAGDYNAILEAAQLSFANDKDHKGKYLESFWLTGAELLSNAETCSNTLLTNSKHFTGAGLIVSRSDDKKMYSLFQCGKFGYMSSPHSHADMLHIDISVGADNFIVDPGTYVYTADRSKRDWFRSAAVHNGPQIIGAELTDSNNPFSWKQKPDCQVLCSLLRPDFDLYQAEYILNTSQAGRCKVIRTILFNKDNFWMLHDRIEVRSPIDTKWNFITEKEVDCPDNSVIIYGDQGNLLVMPGAPNNVGIEIKVVDSEVSTDYLSSGPAHQIQFSVKESSSPEMFTLLLPFTDQSILPRSSDTMSTDQGSCFHFSNEEGDHYLIVSSGVECTIGEIFTNGEVTYLLIADNRCHRLIASRCSAVGFRSETVFKSKSSCDYVDLRRMGTKYNVDTSSVFDMLIPEPGNIVPIKDNQTDH